MSSVTFQSLPEDCDLLKHARTEPEMAENLQFLHKLAGPVLEKTDPDPNQWLHSEAERYFYETARNLFAAQPDFEKRFLYIDGLRWEAIIYLLSEDRRHGGQKNAGSPIARAIFGSEPLNPEAFRDIDIQSGYLSPSQVMQINTFLAHVTVDHLFVNFDPQLMHQQQVALIYPHTEFKFIWYEFVQIQTFYQAATIRKDVVVTFIDYSR